MSLITIQGAADKLRHILTTLLTTLLLVSSKDVLAQTSRGDSLFLEGQKLQKTMTVSSQNQAIKKFQQAKVAYTAQDKKSICDNQIDICRTNIRRMNETARQAGTKAIANKTNTMANEIMKELCSMRNCRAKDGWKTAAKRQNESRRKIYAKLRLFSKATDKNYDRELSDIIINLHNHDVLTIDSEPDKDGYFHPTKYALNIIEQMINKFETIQKKINNQ